MIIEDKNGDQWVVQKDPTTGQTKVTKAEGGGLPPGSNANTTVQADPIKDRIVVLILEQFEEEIAAWLRINGKGGEDDPDVMLALAMPSCFEKDAKFLKYVNENTIPYFKEHPAELRAKIESNQSNKQLLDGISKQFNSVDAVDFNKLSESDQQALSNSTCEAVNESALVIIDRLIACLAGATIDVGLQYTFKWVELWMDDKPVSFTDYGSIFGSMDASQVAVSASIACAAAMIPIIPSSKNKLIVAVVAGLGDGAYAMADNIYKQYDELEAKYPNASVGELIGKINWTSAVQEGGVNFVITGLATGVVLYATGNPKFINFAKQLEDKIKHQGTAFLEKAGLNKQSIELLCEKMGIKLASRIGKTLAFKPSWLPNRTITGNLDNPKGLIGVYDKKLPNGTIIDDTKRALQDLNFPETFASNFETASKDGYKMLNTNGWYYKMDEPGFWEGFNKPWLDDLVSKKADVVMLSDKSNDLLKYQLNPDYSYKTLNGQRIKSGFGKEIDYMENLVQQGKYQWDAINGVYKYSGN